MNRKYIVFRAFRHVTMTGQHMELFRGSEFQARRDTIVTRDGRPIVRIHSENARHHFAFNPDGHGLERGDLTYAIVNAQRHNRVGEGTRLREYERHELLDKFPQYVQYANGFLFTDAFYRAPIAHLREIADYMNIRLCEPIVIQ